MCVCVRAHAPVYIPLSLLSIIGPSVPPHDVVVKVLNSTAVLLEWQSPSPFLINGILLQFTAGYFSSESEGMKTFPSNVRRGVVGNLESWTVYNFTLAAATVAGLGPTAAAQIQTLESG